MEEEELRKREDGGGRIEKEGGWKRRETKWRRRVEEEGGWSKKDIGGERMERVEEEVGRRMKDEAVCVPWSGPQCWHHSPPGAWPPPGSRPGPHSAAPSILPTTNKN
jgi:hypothetical protein